ncbi:cingulin-like protein 1 isoform X1 [Silurus meridionalis]|uniref:cingulin-like protein 1 isoform X1 n=1 Tax=Silurus meridionalis TaxID=175797 RepID=UPI001EEAA3F9|nr:cingulin-like protein 1 isoform X1 [Silurus meridionalis]
MELHGNSRLHDGYQYLTSNEYERIQAARSDGSGTFGVKVQVQGIQGRPYVVLNGQNKSSQSPPVYPDVFFMNHPSQEYVSTMNGQGLSIQRNLTDYRSVRQMQMPPPEIQMSTNTPSSPLLNYQRNPALLRPYDPRSNNLDFHDSPNHIKTKSNSDLNQFSSNTLPVYASNIMVKKAKIPLPGSGKGQTEDNLGPGKSSGENTPCRQSHIVCRLSVPYSNEDNGHSSNRVGRGRHRNQVDPQERKRSQSAGASSSSHSSRTSPVFAGGSRMGEDLGLPASSIGSVSRNDSLLKLKTGENMYQADIRTITAAQFEGQKNEWMSPRLGRANNRIDRANPTRCLQQNGGYSSQEREAQDTPDILNGQQELVDQPYEDVTKQALFNYLKEGSCERDEIIRQKVTLLFEKIQMLRSCAVQNVEELSDSEAKVKEFQERKEALESQVALLKQQLEEEIKIRESLSEASGKSSGELELLQEKLSRSEQEQVSLRQRLTDMEKELQVSIETVLQIKRERERSRAEAKNLQQQLSDMHDVLDNTKSTEEKERDTILQDLANLRMEFQELQQVHEEQEDVLCWKERELIAIKGALQEEISAHAKEVETLKEQHKEAVEKLLKAKEAAEENVAALAQKKKSVEAEQRNTHAQMQELSLAKEQLLGQVRSLETQITTLNNIFQQSKSQEKHLIEQLDKLMEEKKRLDEEFSEVRQQEEDMCGANRALTRHLEDTQCELTKLNQEHRLLKERLKEEERQMEELRKNKRDMEQERRKQDRDFEKLQEEVRIDIKNILVGSERETQKLQDQVDEEREQSSKELSALRIQLHNTQTELEKHSHISQECQKELSGLEAELAQCEAELEKTEQKCKQLEMRVQELQENCNKTAHDDRDRQVKLMEARVAQLQDALNEERSCGDTLVQRMEKVKEQVEQVRAELLQERAVRQDLECDKISLERQSKDLKSRLSHLEVSQKSSQEGLVTKLELRIQELENRLLERERDNNTLEQANRKLERKMKDITMQVNDEQLALQNQMDQLTLRMKVLKRQLDEAEEEIERLENSKKKLQRELDDQQEINEQLYSQISALKTELRRKTKPVMKSLNEEEEDEQWSLSAK